MPIEAPTDLAEWRKQQRKILLARRLSISFEDRSRWSQAIALFLQQGFPSLSRMVVGFCWPYKGEFDARPLMRILLSQGGQAALPAVHAKGEPLQFRQWAPGSVMKPGALGIPVPEGTRVLVPDVLLIPPVGFGEKGGRLGYGGGYFDRTLASLSPQPLKVGVAFEVSRMPTIFPQPHDVLMDFIVTEAGIHAVGLDGLQVVDPAECARREAKIIQERGLPRAQA